MLPTAKVGDALRTDEIPAAGTQSAHRLSPPQLAALRLQGKRNAAGHINHEADLVILEIISLAGEQDQSPNRDASEFQWKGGRRKKAVRNGPIPPWCHAGVAREVIADIIQSGAQDRAYGALAEGTVVSGDGQSVQIMQARAATGDRQHLTIFRFQLGNECHAEQAILHEDAAHRGIE